MKAVARSTTAVRRKTIAGRRRIREARMVAESLKSARHLILAHIVPIRRCNLACTNSVLGGASQSGHDPAIIAGRARALGLTSTLGIVHDHRGQLQALTADQQDVWRRLSTSGPGRSFRFDRYNAFQENLVRSLPNDWRCRAGSRYLYVCEDGLVHYCSQQRGYTRIPLEQYAQDHLDRAPEWINLIYFTFVTLLALTWPLTRGRRIAAAATGLAGLSIVATAQYAPAWVRDWPPAPIMVMAYRQADLFFTRSFITPVSAPTRSRARMLRHRWRWR